MWYSAVGFVVTLTLSLLVAPLAAEAQQATSVHRIGRLSSGSPSEPNLPLEAFRQGLRELGYVEGRNMLIESRYAEGQEDRFPALAADADEADLAEDGQVLGDLRLGPAEGLDQRVYRELAAALGQRVEQLAAALSSAIPSSSGTTQPQTSAPTESLSRSGIVSSISRRT